MGSRTVDLVVARAVRNAMRHDLERAEAARELVSLAQGSWPVVMAALVRVDHALQERWSCVAADAADALRMALTMIERSENVAA